MKLRSRGRGGGYSVWRGVMESALEVVYAGDWPARLWGAVPGRAGVGVNRLCMDLPAGKGDNCRIVFVSDLHVGPTTSPIMLETAFCLIRNSRPDVLLLGGDYVFLDAKPQRLAALGDLVRSIECRIKLAVLGNHDLWTHDKAIVETLSGAGVRVLVNEAARLPNPWEDVAVVGLDDPWTGTCDGRAAFAGTNGEAVRIVICHSPEGLAQISGIPFDLFLAGHNHGGQIAGPWGPIILPRGRLCSRYVSGLGEFESQTVFVSRGIGGVEIPVRTFAPPDIVQLDLRRRPIKKAPAVRGLSSNRGLEIAR